MGASGAKPGTGARPLTYSLVSKLDEIFRFSGEGLAYPDFMLIFLASLIASGALGRVMVRTPFLK